VKSVPFTPLDPSAYREVVRRALAEDLGWGDATTNTIVPDAAQLRARFVAREPCVLAGLDIALEALRQLDPAVAVDAQMADRDTVPADTPIASVAGGAVPLMTSSRTALNFLQRLCGIATLTRMYVDAAAGRITVIDTRDTTPLLRRLEKYAVRAGGAVNHRFSLDDGVLIGRLHVTQAGGVAEAVRRIRTAEPEHPIQVETATLTEVREALDAGASLLLLDGWRPPDVAEAVRLCKGRAKVEVAAAGSPSDIPAIADTGADFVSVSALTRSAPAIDIRFEAY
jgi:nicotinate-nucleotide pyrophosphorylase (carboxylating)